MCNVKDDGETEMTAQNTISVPRRQCSKCGEPAVIIRVSSAFCRDCFVFNLIHKFRSEIGKTKLVREGDKVLIAYSGGPASTLLLHLVVEGLSHRAHKKLRFSPGIVFIDEVGMVEWNDQERDAATSAVLQRLKESGMPAYVSFLYQSLNHCDGSSPDPVYQSIDEVTTPLPYQKEKVQRFHQALSTFSSVSTKEEFIRTLRNQLLAVIAKKAGYSKVMLGDTTTRIAVRILSDLAQGRGSQVASDATFAYKRDPDVMFLRPLRDINSKEVALFNHFHDLKSVFLPTLTTRVPIGSSIDHLTEHFIAELQTNYLSTIHNIISTANKLEQVPKAYDAALCSFCKSPMDVKVGPASALQATEISAQLCTSANRTDDGNKNSSTPSVNGSVASDQLPFLISHARNVVKASLCYGCRLMIKETDAVELFSSCDQRQHVNREQMREMIADLLIDEDEGC